jgi:hypothetical protein
MFRHRCRSLFQWQFGARTGNMAFRFHDRHRLFVFMVHDMNSCRAGRVCLHVSTREPLDGFSVNVILE